MVEFFNFFIIKSVDSIIIRTVAGLMFAQCFQLVGGQVQGFRRRRCPIVFRSYRTHVNARSEQGLVNTVI